MEGYSVNLKECSKNLTARERIAIKDTTRAVKLDEATADGELLIVPDFYAILEIHNEKSEDKDYLNYIVVDKAGNKYITGSESFFTSFLEIFKEMENEDEDYEIVVYRMESKNYKGKSFITCSIV